jgi:hypothetical protein
MRTQLAQAFTDHGTAGTGHGKIVPDQPVIGAHYRPRSAGRSDMRLMRKVATGS